MDLPPCGLYRTTAPIGHVPAERLVYFHNHGDPGPGVYLPQSWNLNRASFSGNGVPLPAPELANTLKPLAAQGMYRVDQEFVCCSKRCRTFPKDLLVQLGYNAAGRPILFEPTWADTGLSLPARGQQVDPETLQLLIPLKVANPRPKSDGQVLH
jgi:hypothetical protein